MKRLGRQKGGNCRPINGGVRNGSSGRKDGPATAQKPSMAKK